MSPKIMILSRTKRATKLRYSPITGRLHICELLVNIEINDPPDLLLRTPLRQKFCEETTWTPEDAIDRGKIIVIDLPVKEFDFAGKMAALITQTSDV